MSNNKTIVKGKIANAITSAAKNHIVATTDDIFDVLFDQYQEDINKKFKQDIDETKENINNISATTIHIEEEIEEINEKLPTLMVKISGNDLE